MSYVIIGIFPQLTMSLSEFFRNFLTFIDFFYYYWPYIRLSINFYALQKTLYMHENKPKQRKSVTYTR